MGNVESKHSFNDASKSIKMILQKEKTVDISDWSLEDLERLLVEKDNTVRQLEAQLQTFESKR